MRNRLSCLESLRLYFRARPNRWVSYIVLAQVAGFGGWRTRISNLRRQTRMRFERREVRKPNGVVDSQYRWKTRSKGIV